MHIPDQDADTILHLVFERSVYTMNTVVRTDLALEMRENAGSAELKGVRAGEWEERGFHITRVDILNEEGVKALCKPVGSYITMSARALAERRPEAFSDGVDVLSGLIRSLLPSPGSLTLVAGLGNAAMTPDAVGPLAADYIIATRHLKQSMPKAFEGLSPVCAVCPGVLGSTGIESAEMLRSICDRVRPAQVIAIDALAAASLDRLCSTLQLSDAGIVPGSGVGNNRAALSEETLGVPVLALGAPTVVDASAFSDDEAAKGMFVTPRDIDASVRSLAKLVGYAIDLALHDGLTISDVDMLKS